MNPCRVQEIQLVGVGFWFVDEADLQGGAGTNLNPNYNSNPDVVLMNNTHPSYWWMDGWYWRVDVWKLSINWDNRLRMWVRETSDDFSFGSSISDGTLWQRIRHTDSELFRRIWHHVINGVQYELRNMSIQVPPDSYSYDLIHTGMEL
jgi:hypothetical protein